MTELLRLPSDGVTVELYGPAAGAARWGAAVWPAPGELVPAWVEFGWQPVGCQITTASTFVGADRGIGVLTQAQGGSLFAQTYDPDRLLDPANAASPFAGALRPGSLMRLSYSPPAYVVERGQARAGEVIPIWAGQLDAITYAYADRRGQIRAVDAVALLTQHQIDATTLPTTLYAFAAAVIERTGWLGTITIEPTPPAGDPAIGAPETTPTAPEAAWSLISGAAIDTLQYAYIGPDLVLRFRPHGDPLDRGFTVGCEGVPAIDFGSASTKDGLVNSLLVRDTTGPTLPVVENADSVRTFGRQQIDRSTRRIPNAASWANAVLADRAHASVEYVPAAVIPTTSTELAELLNLEGVERMHLRFDVPTPAVELDVRYVGRELAVSPDGWSLRLMGYQSDSEWQAGVTPEPPDVTPPPTTQVTRDLVVGKLARISLTSGGAYYGAGAQADGAPVGAWQGWRNRVLWQCTTLLTDLADVVELVSATLRFTTTDQVHVGFGSSPKIRAQRVTQSWSEGTLTVPGPGNSVIWPGPTHTATGETVAAVTTTENALDSIDVTALVRAWLPPAAGGSGVAHYGGRLVAYSETDERYTTELYPDDHATGSRRPVLRCVVKVPI